MYHRQQNKCYLQRNWIIRKAAALCKNFLPAVTNFTHDIIGKNFTMAKIECSFEMYKGTGVPFILLGTSMRRLRHLQLAAATVLWRLLLSVG